MMRGLRHSIGIAALTLAACSSGGGHVETGMREPISLRDDGDECGASLAQSFVGLRANQTVRETVATRSGAATIRWVEPGTAVTMDFSPTRMTAELDQDGVIVTLRCG